MPSLLSLLLLPLFFPGSICLASEHYKGDNGGFPSSAPGAIIGRAPEPGKPCREYLSACEKSCASRDGMFRFLCLGPGFNPESQRYRCQCGDEAFVPLAVNSGSVNR